jgi:hypothetical protein
MLERGNGPGFTQKSLGEVGLLAQMGVQDFDGHLALQRHLDGTIYLGHATRAQETLQLIFAANCLPN